MEKSTEDRSGTVPVQSFRRRFATRTTATPAAVMAVLLSVCPMNGERPSVPTIAEWAFSPSLPAEGYPPMSSAIGVKGNPWASATGWYTTRPSATLTPSARAGSPRTASFHPWAAILRV